MSVSLIVVSLGAVVAVVGTGVLTARCARAPRMYLMAQALALFGLAVSLGAQILGYQVGYGGLTFRVMEVGAQVIAPLALCLGLTELLGRSVAARFAMRLAVSAVGVITIVILWIDPLSTVTAFGKHWPDAATVYDLVPKALIQFVLAPFATLTAISAIVVAAVRSRRDPTARDAFWPVAAGGVAAIAVAVPGISWSLQKYAGLPSPLSASTTFALACLLAAALTLLAAELAGRRGLGERQSGGAQYGADGQLDEDIGPGGYQSGDYDGYGAGAEHPGGYGRDELGAGYGGAAYGADSEYDRNDHDPSAMGARTGGHDVDGRYPALAALAAEYPSDPGYGSARDGGPDRPAGLGGQMPADDDSPAQLFGQIAIYTLIEERIDEFDRLTERVVAQVRAREPDTLVYIVHAVPTAPNQRILYEVYRDRAAYDEHLQRPYLVRYEAERRPFVLATNEIELGLQQAKVSPLPSISDILSESGIDLTGVTRSPSRAASSPSGSYPAGAPGGEYLAGPVGGEYLAGPVGGEYPGGPEPSGELAQWQPAPGPRGEDPWHR